MLRHEFQPGRLIAGGFFTLAGVVYAGDAGGLWETPWFAVVPLVVVGLCLAGVAGIVARSLRRRRRTGRDTAPATGTEAGSTGAHPGGGPG
ncbi:hypothetical protein [Streptomyces sp. DSM 15324]|uniref:hypothetical protein n=1 Tax=Streptomyces sp. DSM 15324 TaxID=1739111 RepID=UPI0007481744|nr:hypothetical protein [Streptomyces sp. DSM 15324]KUO12029.1 hypothetical protein AQJ58_12865 [Streptomyces sp. DSM 15324]